MKAPKSYKDLTVWKKSMDFVERVYSITGDFPAEERFALTIQMRKAAVSIPSNIAEGQRRGTRKDYARFVLIAYGSGAELETQLEIAKRLKYLNDVSFTDTFELLQEIMKMLNRLERSLKNPTNYHPQPTN